MVCPLALDSEHAGSVRILPMDFIPLVEKGVMVPRAVVQTMLSKQHQHSLNWSVVLCFAPNHWVFNVLGFLPPSLQSTNTWSGFLLVKSAAVEQMRMSSLISSVRKETQVFKCKSSPKIFPPALQACDLNNTHRQPGKCRIIWLSERHNKLWR